MSKVIILDEATASAAARVQETIRTENLNFNSTSHLINRRFLASIKSVEPKSTLFKPIIPVNETDVIIENSINKLKAKDPNLQNYMKKYENKIKAKQEEILKNPTLKKQQEDKLKQAETERQQRRKSFSERQKRRLSNKGDGNVVKLDTIVNLEKLKMESKDSIEAIWNQYHQSKEGFLSGVLTKEFFEKLINTSKQFPMFIIPLPREQGYEFFYLQFEGNRTFFTSLLEFKTKQENAKPYLVLTNFTELKDTKNIVLMQGEIDVGEINGKQKLTNIEAQTLVYQMQNFYVIGGEKKIRLLEKFHKTPNEFDYQELLDEAERLGVQ
ncbi:hypothetical protein HK099_002455 [Clydaea vesicula]|uniref:ATP synthase mitochondrial F1 complex assembly factor 1 n=1 Tax=Clydaea vesicula TaxID=447962 RepID=A0AAD5U5W1_9FUNG|nr:hypothetical protein HK099_002455 [Clydaea vesicula]